LKPAILLLLVAFISTGESIILEVSKEISVLSTKSKTVPVKFEKSLYQEKENVTVSSLYTS
jgi:hypothetical protein